MNLTERLNVLIQAASLSQKNGLLTLDEAVKAKTAIDIISSGTLNQQFTSAINALIEIAIVSQKKGSYSLKDAYMLYLAIEGIESELQNEVNRLNSEMIKKETQIPQSTQVLEPEENKNNSETIVTIPPKTIMVGS